MKSRKKTAPASNFSVVAWPFSNCMLDVTICGMTPRSHPRLQVSSNDIHTLNSRPTEEKKALWNRAASKQQTGEHTNCGNRNVPAARGPENNKILRSS